MERLLAQLNTKEIKKQLIGLGELKSWLESHSISVSDVATIKQGILVRYVLLSSLLTEGG